MPVQTCNTDLLSWLVLRNIEDHIAMFHFWDHNNTIIPKTNEQTIIVWNLYLWTGTIQGGRGVAAPAWWLYGYGYVWASLLLQFRIWGNSVQIIQRCCKGYLLLWYNLMSLLHLADVCRYCIWSYMIWSPDVGIHNHSLFLQTTNCWALMEIELKLWPKILCAIRDTDILPSVTQVMQVTF